MLEVIHDVPAGALGIRATGKVTANDYLNVVFPAFEFYAKRTNSFKYLMLLETDVSNFAIDAWLNDMVLGFQYFTKWNKVAIVSNQPGVITFTNTVGKLAPGEYKGFTLSQLVQAKEWLAA
jgi:hypothetical protein